MVNFTKKRVKSKEDTPPNDDREDDVEKVGRTSGKILTTHLLKPESEQQES